MTNQLQPDDINDGSEEGGGTSGSSSDSSGVQTKHIVLGAIIVIVVGITLMSMV